MHDFHEWEFRTVSKYLGTKEDDRPALAGRIAEGLRDDALTIAMRIGYERLATSDGVEQLVKEMKDTVFLYKDRHRSTSQNNSSEFAQPFGRAYL